MPDNAPLDILPLWALLIGVFVLVLLSVEGGYRLGTMSKHAGEDGDSPLGEMVGATLGLLAFLLAFTFSLAASRYDTRRQLLLDEANAIGTTWLRAGFLPEGGAEIRSLLRQYTDVRLQASRARDLPASIRQSELLQGQLWARTEPLAKRSENPVMVALYIQSLNDLIDLHSKRLTASVRNRIPLAIWAALYSVTVMSFGALGYHAGLVRAGRSLAILPVAFTFVVVIGLIADLDRPQEGTLTVGQEPLFDVLKSMDVPTGQ
ncbi:MAG: bestrophin-like domain [Telluria sp.]